MVDAGDMQLERKENLFSLSPNLSSDRMEDKLLLENEGDLMDTMHHPKSARLVLTNEIDNNISSGDCMNNYNQTSILHQQISCVKPPIRGHVRHPSFRDKDENVAKFEKSGPLPILKTSTLKEQ